MAFHNHARGQSPYWKPEQVLAACQNRSPRISGCCDAGQWARSGLDPVTGKNFDHRKVWIQERLAFLAGQFAIDIGSIAIMSNLHVVVRNRPDIAGQWSDEVVARRWKLEMGLN